MKIKIDFVDFYKELNKEDNFFINKLREICDVEISSNPDLIFFSNYGIDHLYYSCFKVFYSAENVRPDYRFCDFSMTFDYIEDKRNFRLPLYCIHLNEFNTFVKEYNIKWNQKTRFCNFVYSNHRAKERIDFFHLLSKYKQIDSPGSVLNNIPNSNSGVRYDYKSKLEFLSNYKFTIAFENESFPGYTTEKIIHPLLVGSIPIYWGNPLISKEFDESIFINVHSFNSFDDVVEKIIEIDLNYEAYIEKIRDYNVYEVILTSYEEGLIDFLKFIISFIKESTPVSSSFHGCKVRFGKMVITRANNMMIKINKYLK